MISFKKAKAALRALIPKGLDQSQTGARSLSGSTLNYSSVTTIAPSRLASAFAQADQGYITEQAKLFELIEKADSHIFAELNKRRLAVTGLKWKLQPPKDANQSEIDRTAELQNMLMEIPGIEDTQFDVTDAIGKGLTMLEIHWKAGEVWLPEKIEFIPQRLFQTDRDTQEVQYLNMGIPEPLLPMKWIKHEHRATSGYIEQSALFRVLAWTYAYKAYNVKDMQRFLEVYGLPLRLGKYPAGITDKQRNELLRAVRGIGNDGAGVIPANMVIDFVQAQAGKVDDFLNAIAYWESKQSKAILGGDIDGKVTTDTRITMYEKVRKEFTIHDVKQIEPTYNDDLIKPIALLNGMFKENRLPRWCYDTDDAADQKSMVEVLTKAVTIGMEVDVDEAHRLLQIPRAKEGAKILMLGSQVNPKSALRAAMTNQRVQPETISDNIAKQLTDLSMTYEQAQQEMIAALVAESGDIESAIEKVGALNLNKSPIYKEWVDLMTKANVAANLAGRAEATHE